jgi:hypothetical protein
MSEINYKNTGDIFYKPIVKYFFLFLIISLIFTIWRKYNLLVAVVSLIIIIYIFNFVSYTKTDEDLLNKPVTKLVIFIIIALSTYRYWNKYLSWSKYGLVWPIISLAILAYIFNIVPSYSKAIEDILNIPFFSYIIIGIIALAFFMDNFLFLKYLFSYKNTKYL